MLLQLLFKFRQGNPHVIKSQSWLKEWTSSRASDFSLCRIEAYGPPSLLELMADLAASSCPAGAAAPKTGPGCPCAPSAEVNARAAEQMAAAQVGAQRGGLAQLPTCVLFSSCGGDWTLTSPPWQV